MCIHRKRIKHRICIGGYRPGQAQAVPRSNYKIIHILIILANLASLYIERDLPSILLWDKIDKLLIRFAQTHNNTRIYCLNLVLRADVQGGIESFGTNISEIFRCGLQTKEHGG